MCGNSSSVTVVTDTAATEEQTGSTRLETTLTLGVPGTAAYDSLAMRLSTLAHNSGGRFTYGEISFDEAGQPVCPVGYDCSQYNPSVDGQPDPAAVRDFRELVEGVNADRCLLTGELIAR